MTYQFTEKNKRTIIGLIAIGLVLLLIGIAGGGSHGSVEDILGPDHEGGHGFGLGARLWNALYMAGFFFFAVALGALFFLALQYATESGWFVAVKRPIEAVASALPIGSIVLLIVFIGATLHWNHIFHWMDPELHDPSSPHYDSIIANKSAYLNVPFFWARTIIYLITFYMFYKGFRKRSLQEDLEGGTAIHFTNYRKGAIFLVFFAVFSSTFSWDWIMSIDTHWFSTLFGWFVFSGMWCSAMVAITLLVVYLKKKGYLDQVNDSHIHDLGKWMFATSFLWSYLWFSQFMLIWYADIPEEVTYFVARINDYKPVFFGSFIVNFVFPMLFLMSRDAKRNFGMLMTIGGIIFVSHFVDVYLLITPGTAFDHGAFGLIEVGMFLTFLGIFIAFVLKTLTKAPIMPVNNPYLEESIHHHI